MERGSPKRIDLDYFDTYFLENFGHELYTEAPKEIASMINEWLAYSQ